MFVRYLKKEDLLQSKKISALAFEYSYNLEVNEDNFFGGNMLGAYTGENDENPGTLFSFMYLNRYKMAFDGNFVKCVGIGGVATHPQYRRSGGIRAIFKQAFEDMRNNGEIFSTLFPFSYAYYNKFGYQATSRVMNIKVPFSQLEKFAINTDCVLCENNKDENLRLLADEYAIKHNLALDGECRKWSRLPNEPFKAVYYAYVYIRPNDGTPAGYFTYKLKNEGGSRIFLVPELYYKTPQDLKGMLGFMRVFSSQYSKLEFEAIPPQEDFSLLFNDYYSLEISERYSSMARVVDAQKALLAMRYPEEAGSFSIKIHDDTAPWNDGVFKVEFENKTAKLAQKLESKDINTDVEVSNRALARIILGTENILSPMMSFDEELKIYKNENVLSRVFVKKASSLFDRF